MKICTILHPFTAFTAAVGPRHENPTTSEPPTDGGIGWRQHLHSFGALVLSCSKIFQLFGFLWMFSLQVLVVLTCRGSPSQLFNKTTSWRVHKAEPMAKDCCHWRMQKCSWAANTWVEGCEMWKLLWWTELHTGKSEHQHWRTTLWFINTSCDTPMTGWTTPNAIRVSVPNALVLCTPQLFDLYSSFFCWYRFW